MSLTTHRRRRRRSAALTLLLGLILTAGAAEDPRARLQALEQDLGRLETWLASTRGDRDALEKELERGDLALAELAEQVRATERALIEQRPEQQRLTQEVADLSERELASRAALQAEIRRAWLVARRGPLQLLLEAEDPERIARLLAYHEHLTRARIKALDQFRSTRQKLQQRRVELATVEDRLRRERDQLTEQATRLERARTERASALARLDQEIGAREANREELLQTREELSKLLERLARQTYEPSGATFAASRGTLPWPVDGRIRQAYTATRGSSSRRWGGVLLAAESGSTVRAVHPGRVVFADWMRGFGLLVIVDHGGGYMSLYAQAESLLRSAGDTVAAGDALATAGQSGGSAESGVWFEIRKDGKPEDPGRWCRPKA